MEDNFVIQERRKKIDALRDRGINPYPNDFRPKHKIKDLIAEHGEKERDDLHDIAGPFVIAGRIMFLREFGKLAFLKLKDVTGAMQVSLSIDGIGEEQYKLFKDMCDMGDIVGVSGTLTRTNKGEFTLQGQSFEILNKTVRPLPDKWHGLADVEQRYRQRYVDLIVNDDAMKVALTRPKIIQAIRKYMIDRDFVEVETPSLQVLAGGGHARPFKTHHNALGLDLNMRIALELDHKRLVVGGLDRVFEIGRLYRNEGISVRHNPEFTMMESYMAYGNFHDQMDLVEELMSSVTQEICGTLQVPYGDETIDMGNWTRLTMRDALLQLGGAEEADLQDLESLRAFAKKHGIDVPEWADYGQAFLTCFEETCEHKLKDPTFIYDYPRSTSPLARCYDDRPDWAQRSELFIGGREYANLYSELNDPADQKERFEAQMEEKERGNDEAMPFDEDYIRALEYGMPPTTGLGIGIDRFIMLLTNQPSIRDVILFPLMRPEAQAVEQKEEDESAA